MDPEVFLTPLYVMVDDFCKAHLPEDRTPGPPAKLSRSEVICLAIYGQWENFGCEQRFYAWAQRHLKGAFPTLPHYSQFNRLARRYHQEIALFALYLAEVLGARTSPYQPLDSTDVPVRDRHRRGEGWLLGADIGSSTRWGWFEGLRLLAAVSAEGIITGFGFGPASANDHALADTFLGLRQHPHPRLVSVGKAAEGPHVADKGFEGATAAQRWREEAGAEVLAPPRRTAVHPWSGAQRRQLVRWRQIVETVYSKLHGVFGLRRERPHALSGFQMRLAAKVALHNFCFWLNTWLGNEHKLAFVALAPI